MCFHCLQPSVTCYTERDMQDTQARRKTQTQDECMSLTEHTNCGYFTYMSDADLILEEEPG